MSRPEHIAPPEVFYNDEEAKKYAGNSRMIEIQSSMAARAIELLGFPQGESKLVLDIGCGSGLSGEVLNEMGHTWIGLDISASMLGVAIERQVDGDLIHSDMGQGLFFRPGSFDGAISISALQWLNNADKRSHEPWKRLLRFFQSLYNCLARGSRAVFQFYPENAQQLEMVTSAAMRCGFGGGILVDYPNSTKAKKTYLILNAGTGPGEKGEQGMPMALGVGNETKNGGTGRIQVDSSSTSVFAPRNRKRLKTEESRKERIVRKKERARGQGKKVPSASKYTARKRTRGF